MRSNRTRTGGTLALIAISIVVVAIVGIGLFFMTRLVGGHRELDFATRSGNLNVAKQAIANPAEQLNPGMELDNFTGLTDKDPIAGGGVNLRVYNRLVGQALLVALNAKADGGPTGKTNASNLVNTMQSASGIGGRLRGQFTAQGNTNGFFDFLGLRNSTRMLGAGQLAANVYQSSWVEAGPADIGATNILVPQANQLPINTASGTPEDVPASFKRKLKQSDNQFHEYFRGYQGLDLGLGVPCSLIGVPVQPGSQPHLVSSTEFTAGLNRFGTAGQFVPPNAFEYGSQKQDQYTAGNASSASRAVVGALSAEFAPSIPLGYMVVDNPNGVNHPGGTDSGWGVLQHELDKGRGGITVDNKSKVFSTNKNLMNKWRNHNAKSENGDFNGKCPNNCPSPTTNGLYNADGDAATKAEAHQISSAPGNTTGCDDTNSAYGKAPDGTQYGQAPCPEMLNTFDKAYSPNGGDYKGANNPGNNLTAIESAKADVMDQFNGCGKLNLSHNSGNPNTATTTGLRVWKCAKGQRCPWTTAVNPNKAQISRDGTIAELFDQTESGKGAEVNTFITQRLLQIKPSATDAEIDAVLTKTVPLSASKFYIYMDGTDGSLHFDHTKPPGASAIQAADGTPHISKSSPYENNSSWVNPKKENHIHNQMYKCPSGNITATDTAGYTPSCGFNNKLGEFSFANDVTTSGTYYCCPD